MVTNFHDLYQRYAQDVYRFAFWLCGDPHDAEDITSDTFVQALTAPGEIRSETVKSYLLTIARNLAFKKAHRARRFTPISPEMPAANPGPEQHVETSLELQTVLQFLQTLPEIDRAALVLRIQQDLSYEEIAGALEISLPAARVRVHRARLKLNAFRLNQEQP